MTPDDALDFVQQEEGGIADVGDGKGVTSFGQTPQWLAEWHLPVPKTRGEARENWRLWLQKTRLDGVVGAHPKLGLTLMDWAVHSGHVMPVRSLQALLGLNPDGMVGPATLHALGALSPDGIEMVRLRLIAARMGFLGRLITDKPERHAKYAAGWFARLGRLLTR